MHKAQFGCEEISKDDFWQMINEKVGEVPLNDYIIIGGDLNGHIGKNSKEHEYHLGFGYDKTNADELRILELADAQNLVVTNSMFRKR